MVVISLAQVRLKSQILLASFLLLFCSIPFQKPIKGILGRFTKAFIPSDITLPSYFPTTIPFVISDLCSLLFIGLLCVYFRPTLKQLIWKGPSKYLSLFIIAAFISILLSTMSTYALPYVMLSHLALYCLLFSAITTSASMIGRQLLIQGFAWSLLGVGLFEAGMALCQYFFQSNVGCGLLGEFSLENFPFAWNSSALFIGGSLHEGIVFRASGSFSHPNILGCLLFCSSLATYYLWAKSSQKWYLLALFIQFLGICVTFSRSALLACVLGSIILCIGLWRQRRFSWKQVMFLGAILGVGLALFLPAMLSRGGVFNYQGPATGADSERMYYNKIAFELWEQHPWFGVGYNNFQLHTQLTYAEMPGHLFHSKVHNIYLLIAAETGFVGLLCFLLFLFYLVYPLFRQLGRAELGLERVVLLASFIGMLFIGGCDFFLLCTPVGVLMFFGVASLSYLTQSEIS